MRVALLSFFADRLKVHLREQGVGHDLINAIFAERGAALEDDLFRLTEKAHRLAAFLRSDDGANLLVAYRRASNIVRAEQKKGWVANGNAVDRALFRQPEEHALYEALGRVRGIDLGVIEAGAFEGYLQDLAGLRRPVDAFFDKVTVNAEDAALRDNRLKFMQAIGAKMDAVADFSKIEG
jgi:glycyl-tRNA synthetase beta chain